MSSLAPAAIISRVIMISSAGLSPADVGFFSWYVKCTIPSSEEGLKLTHPRSPNSAVPTRTCVAPSIMAVSKSPLMPIERPSSP